MGAPMSAARPRRDEGTAPNATGRKALSRKGSPVIAEIFFWILLSSVEAPGLGGLQPIRTPTPETEGFYPQSTVTMPCIESGNRTMRRERSRLSGTHLPPMLPPLSLSWLSISLSTAVRSVVQLYTDSQS